MRQGAVLEVDYNDIPEDRRDLVDAFAYWCAADDAFDPDNSRFFELLGNDPELWGRIVYEVLAGFDRFMVEATATHVNAASADASADATHDELEREVAGAFRREALGAIDDRPTIGLSFADFGALVSCAVRYNTCPSHDVRPVVAAIIERAVEDLVRDSEDWREWLDEGEGR